MSDHAVYRLNKQMEAANALRDALGASSDPEKALFDDDCVDHELVRDMIEGETDLHEMIAATVASMDEDSILSDGLKTLLDALKQRQDRIQKRIAVKRAALEQAMVIGELKTLELPTMTLTVRRTPPSLQITDESSIPPEYWKAKDPALDKRAVLAALKDGAAIPGAQLDNGGVALQLRRN